MNRLPRFTRTSTGRALQLTLRDQLILRHVAMHRFLSSRQILALVGGSPQHLLKRLQKLFHHGYLDRPRAQVRYFSEEGPQPVVYALGQKGAKVVAKPNGRSSRYDNRTIKQLYLQHTLLVAEVMIAFIRAARGNDSLRLQLEEDLASVEAPGTAFRWSVTVRHEGESRRVGVVPDRMFALEKPNGERVLFFVEADRATMPVTRRSLAQTSMLRKLLAYAVTWEQGLVKERFGCERFRVLTVTANPERAHHLAEVCGQLSHGRGLFLFADTAMIHGRVFPDFARGVLEIPWLNGYGETERLVDSLRSRVAA